VIEDCVKAHAALIREYSINIVTGLPIPRSETLWLVQLIAWIFDRPIDFGRIPLETSFGTDCLASFV